MLFAGLCGYVQQQEESVNTPCNYDKQKSQKKLLDSKTGA